MSMHTQIIEKDGKPEYAVVPFAEYRRLVELAEMAQDLHDFDTTVRELDEGREELIPHAVTSRLLQGDEHPLRVWREYRGFTQADLAQRAGIGKSYLSQIEAGHKTGSASVLHALARALSVDIDDLIPID
ncbi:helix-turn-helix domain-containing protein [Ectothiorhodospira mobilis]|uniref:helix-turn-helix domain-containing protein n=1 Tax=Ectothiorhodospira mobilis TaxID=195064 RepID=UPI001EE7E09B|nr:helix-turn-helix transcriptional regulator [Ectothiorhodospira mobilis]MCG5536475.1 helix-turn-helix transcriptional regulator [Ectothiorhodospira mobilis]